VAQENNAEARPVESADRLHLVLDTLPALVVCALPDGSVDFLNRGWQEYTGRSLQDLFGRGWQTSIHPDDVAKFMQEWDAARAAGNPFENEARVRRHDGVYHWFSIRKVPLRDQANQIVRWYGTGHDIDDRKQTEDGLQLAIDTTPALIHSARPDGFIDYFNKGWLDYFGVPAEELYGWGWTKTFHPDDVEACVDKWRAALASGESFEGEGRVRRADGEYRTLLHHKVPLRDNQGHIVKWR
jgi:PAS domain S-box-containing protein